VHRKHSIPKVVPRYNNTVAEMKERMSCKGTRCNQLLNNKTPRDVSREEGREGDGWHWPSRGSDSQPEGSSLPWPSFSCMAPEAFWISGALFVVARSQLWKRSGPRRKPTEARVTLGAARGLVVRRHANAGPPEGPVSTLAPLALQGLAPGPPGSWDPSPGAARAWPIPGHAKPEKEKRVVLPEIPSACEPGPLHHGPRSRRVAIAPRSASVLTPLLCTRYILLQVDARTDYGL
jgi:hypothetical protein